jgi:hypothetical protein
VTIKLEGHNVVDRLNMKYKKFVGGIAMSMVFLKNFLMNLKRESQCNMNTIKNFFLTESRKFIMYIKIQQVYNFWMMENMSPDIECLDNAK